MKMIYQTVEGMVKYYGPYDGGIDDLLEDVGRRGLLGKARKAEDYRLLYCMAQTLGGPVLEQGSCYGLSTRCISRGLGSRQTTIYAVDLEHQWAKHHLPDIDPDNLMLIDGDSTAYAPPEECAFGFEDTDHTYATTRANLERQVEAGCHTVLVHDCGEHVQGPRGDVVWDCRRAALEVFSGWDLFDIDSDSGMILAQRRD